ncbi:ABC transporter substrate-binding protein [Luteimicrobium subarcticum]|uniref:ABC-type glycerol-3-phosphate transport system substrate-binding protein n=1 Tax=Luteimicrobium subarcticum TaxID=620910 RepID=A0A2M8W1T2_9MICO|nr:extracellular solute-binding protein [Luteimicrobium subarcticum]PJI84876.1 ABC-type glycerol-3-phosphate transport system substrate-binding protein [Luteimicrobium subarcticum]
MKSSTMWRAAGAVGAVALGLGSLTACSSGSSGSPESPSAAATLSGPVTITVAIDQGLNADAKAQFDQRVAVFEKANPLITVKSQEYTWTATTFTADLAGGTLPDVFPIPFTDGRGLIAQEQIADISPLVKQLPYADTFNKNVATEGEDADGNMWAVPIAAYGQGLHYNRALFTEAGLDPDKPPTTWDEVRADAKQISDKTGMAGLAMMTKSNTGGWILTTMDNAFGGRVEDTADGTTTATVDTDQMKEVAQYLHDLRWTDNSMGQNFLYDWAGINQDFAAGKIGMYVSGGGNLPNLITQNNMDVKDYGLTVLPLQGDDAGALGGGTLAAVSAKATQQEQIASVKWIDFYYVQQLVSKDAAVASAEQSVANKQPVGAPQLPIFDQATYQQQQEWIKPYVNVPLDQMTGYTDNVFGQPLVPEPGVGTQDVYAKLDNVVQTILTQKDADIDKLLSDAQTQAQRVVDSNS